MPVAQVVAGKRLRRFEMKNLISLRTAQRVNGPLDREEAGERSAACVPGEVVTGSFRKLGRMAAKHLVG